MGYTTDSKVRYYLDAEGLTGIGTNVIGTAVVTEHIARTDSIIDLKLSKRYDVPFATGTDTPPAIVTISNHMTGYRALRSIYSGEVPRALEFVQDDYQKAIDLLKEIQAGEVDVIGTDGNKIAELGASTQYYSSTQSYTPTFDVDSELEWRVDSDRLDDIANARG